MEPKVKEAEKRRDGTVASGLDNVQEATTAVKEDVALWIREYRVTAVAGALAAGILLGMLIRR